MGRAERVALHIGALNWHAVRLYRLSRRLWLSDHRALALLAGAMNRVLTGVEIPPTAEFGDGLIIMHGHGIVVHPHTRAGRDCVLYQQVTIGSRSVHGAPPTLGDGVMLFPGARVLGDITIGDGAVIGANAVVISDVRPASVITVEPATCR
jgi:serine O-acetyltransferase